MTWDIWLAQYLNTMANASLLAARITLFCATYLAYLLVATVAFWLWRSSMTNRQKIYAAAVVVGASALSRFGVAELIRFFYHRPRPFVALPQIHPLFTDSAWSFPSGHATFFFAIAAAAWFFDRSWGAIFFSGAVLITLARVAAGLHYPSDIIAGMLIGIACAYLVRALTYRWSLARTSV